MNDIIDIWFKGLLESTNKATLEELTEEEIRAEIEEVEGTISNERLWAHVNSIHEENIAVLMEYLEVLYQMILLKDGTRVIMSDGRVGTIQGNDWNENRDWGFENVNYYVYPLSGGGDYEMYLAKDLVLAEDKKLLVCEHCLMAIESHEGHQATLTHYVDEDNDEESKCDWCGEIGFDTLYELV